MNFVWLSCVNVSSSEQNMALVGDDDNGEGYAYVRAGSICEISVPYSWFCCEPKAALKKWL